MKMKIQMRIMRWQIRVRMEWWDDMRIQMEFWDDMRVHMELWDEVIPTKWEI